MGLLFNLLLLRMEQLLRQQWLPNLMGSKPLRMLLNKLKQ
jgi:hypothetical protein